MMHTFLPQTTSLTAKFFRGFADRSRLSILEALCTRPLTVSALVEHTGLSQPNVSNHLRCLLECGLVSRTQQWRSVTYQLRDERIARLLALAEDVLAEVAREILACPRYQEVGESPTSLGPEELPYDSPSA